MKANRWTTARRFVQCGIIGLLMTPHWSRTVFEGNLAAAALFGLELSDPMATLQVLLLTGTLTVTLLVGTGLVLAGYGFLGGRIFCGWICPVHLLTDLAEMVPWRDRLPRWRLHGKSLSLGVILVVTLLLGIPAFETISPIGISVRALTFGADAALGMLVLIVLAEWLLSRRVWCRALCPLGGFYAILGRVGLVCVTYRPDKCTHCCRCLQVCFVPEVLKPSLTAQVPHIHAGDCTRCGACVGACPEEALGFGLRKPLSI